MSEDGAVQVLLIEDSEREALLVKQYLKQSTDGKFGFCWVSTSEEAIPLLRTGGHDVVLLDYFLGDVTGLELIDRFPEVTRRVPVILLTGCGNGQVDEEALKRGVFDYIDKNELTAPLLERAIRYAVRNFGVLQSFERLFNDVFEGVIVHDGERLLQANDAFLRMIRMDQEQVIGAELASLFNPQVASVLATTVSADPAETQKAPIEIDIVNQQGPRCITEVRVRAHQFRGKPCFLVAFSDVTRRKLAEEALLRTNAELEARIAQRTEALERSNQDLARFAEIVAHDIQGPLRTVSQYLAEVRTRELAATGEDADPFRLLFVDRAVQAVQRVKELVTSVHTYSRISARDMLTGEVELNGLIQEIVSEFDREIRAKKMEVTVGRLPTVQGDRSLLSSLFRNLLSNAIKYSNGTDPWILVEVADTPGEWLFSVKDNGIGFEPEEAQHIFDMFRRAGNSTSRHGSGIGLASCLRIVGLHGGRIWATSELGKGATFFFTLPKNGNRDNRLLPAVVSGTGNTETDSRSHFSHQ